MCSGGATGDDAGGVHAVERRIALPPNDPSAKGNDCDSACAMLAPTSGQIVLKIPRKVSVSPRVARPLIDAPHRRIAFETDGATGRTVELGPQPQGRSGTVSRPDELVTKSLSRPLPTGPVGPGPDVGGSSRSDQLERTKSSG